MKELLLICCLILDVYEADIINMGGNCITNTLEGTWSGHYQYYSPDIPYKYYDLETESWKDNPWVPPTPFILKPVYKAYVTIDYCFLIEESLQKQLTQM